MQPTRITKKPAKKTPSKKAPAPLDETPAPEPRDSALESYAQSLYPIVCVGASAGGIEAFNELLRALPEKPGMAFIFVLHQDPHHVSALADVLTRSTRMPVTVIGDGMRIEPDRVHVAPPDGEVVMTGGVLRVLPRRHDGIPLPIDTLLRSLAEDQGSRGIAVILSGSGSDGAVGSKAVKAEGGITFAQDESARFTSMPRSAVAVAAVDLVLPPGSIAKELVRIAQHSYVSGPLSESGRLPEGELGKIFSLLQVAHGVDFTLYKPSTIERRVRRRMAVHRLEELSEYVAYMREHGDEVDLLYGDILIRVTAFFRDRDVYEALERDVLPKILAQRRDEEALRVWVAGCSTGEEVYSLAIALHELVTAAAIECPVQIFGTDISDGAVELARAGIYPENIAADVSAERLRRFFTKVDGGYRVIKSIRDCCIFARQNLTKDPPFSRLDLVSCRNVLIYLGAALQRNVISIFHYALRPDGYLLLGSSEAIGSYTELFSVADRRHKIYQKKLAPKRMAMHFAAGVSQQPERFGAARVEEEMGPPNVYREADRMLLARYVPAGVLINDAMEIVQFRGRTSAFLEPAPGAASFNLFKMAREGLLTELRTAIHTARKQDGPVRREGARVRNEGGFMTVNVEVMPVVTVNRERFFLVLFSEVPLPVEAPPSKRSRSAKALSEDVQQVARLKRELEASREYLQSIIEEQEAMNEELRSANEEIQSSNEELQSTNEELETAKEELQSSNEELTTLNEELENRNQELAEVNDDLVNLLSSVEIPIVMLDSELRIRRFNPRAQRTLNLIANDIGRSINDLKMTLRLDDLEERITSVIQTLTMQELEVQDHTGRWYSLRIRPYRTNENRIDGAVLVLIDISAGRSEPR